LARAFIEADGGRLELRRASPPIFAIFLAVGRAPGSTEAAAPIAEVAPVSAGSAVGG